jgi:glycosyltransferase involved in cell wall biosynthesis
MIGKDYGMFDYCIKLASDLDNQITLLENSPEETKLKALALATICVVPSSYEGFGIVALEAQASGIPVIASKRGGLKDVIIDRVTGLHIDPTLNQISNAIEYLLGRPSLCRKMGLEGKMFAKDFSWDNVALKLEEVYQEVL